MGEGSVRAKRGGERMNFKKLIGIFATLWILALFACSTVPQKPQGQAPESRTPESSSVFVIGKVDYQPSEGGYFILGDHPFGKIYRIANQKPEVLEPLLKTGDKHVNVEGHLTPGTNLLSIEKIWGKPY